MIWNIWVANDIDETENITIGWSWYPASTQTGGDQKKIEWKVRYNNGGENTAILPAASAYTQSNTVLATDEVAQTMHTERVAFSGIKAGDWLNVVLYRDATNVNDTMVGDAVMSMTGFLEYTSDKLGGEL